MHEQNANGIRERYRGFSAALASRAASSLPGNGRRVCSTSVGSSSVSPPFSLHTTRREMSLAIASSPPRRARRPGLRCPRSGRLRVHTSPGGGGRRSHLRRSPARSGRSAQCRGWVASVSKSVSRPPSLARSTPSNGLSTRRAQSAGRRRSLHGRDRLRGHGGALLIGGRTRCRSSNFAELAKSFGPRTGISWPKPPPGTTPNYGKPTFGESYRISLEVTPNSALQSGFRAVPPG